MNVKHPTPEERALELWSHMQLHTPRPTAWDMICFCTEALGVFAAGDYTFLKDPVKNLVSVVYTAHNAMDDMPSCLVIGETKDVKATNQPG